MKASNEYKSVLARVSLTLLITSLAACDRGADPDMNAGNAGASPGYDAGYEFGIKLALLRQQQPEIELDDALDGLRDALSETSQSIGSTEMCARLQPVEDMPAEVELSPETVQPPETQPSSDSFEVDSTNDDALNTNRNGMVTLPSGVQYQVLYEGSGEPPQAGDTVRIRYQAYLDNGSVIETSDENDSLVLALDGIVAPGLKEVLLLMNSGASWQVVIPPSTGYSSPGSRMFKGRENRIYRPRDLIYNIELVSIDRAQPAKAGN